MRIESLFELAARVEIPFNSFHPEYIQLDKSTFDLPKSVVLVRIRHLMPPYTQHFSLKIWGVDIPEEFISEDVFSKIEEIILQKGSKEEVEKELKIREDRNKEALRILAKKIEIEEVLKKFLPAKK